MPIPSPKLETRTYSQQENDAQRITCPQCHAPIGTSCVAVMWVYDEKKDQFDAMSVARDYHPKRLRAADRWRSFNVAR